MNIKDSFTIEPTSTEEIEKAYVDGAKKLNAQVLLEDYNSEWPIEFDKQKKVIQESLNHLSITVEHVGSTSVPGLAAKPILDILLVVPDSTDESSYVPQLETNGFKLHIREPDWNEHRMFKGLTYNINLHVFTEGNIEIKKMLKFRDHLRENKSDLDLYLAKKRELSTKVWQYMQNYADAKSEVVIDIFSRIEI